MVKTRKSWVKNLPRYAANAATWAYNNPKTVKGVFRSLKRRYPFKASNTVVKKRAINSDKWLHANTIGSRSTFKKIKKGNKNTRWCKRVGLPSYNKMVSSGEMDTDTWGSQMLWAQEKLQSTDMVQDCIVIKQEFYDAGAHLDTAWNDVMTKIRLHSCKTTFNIINDSNAGVTLFLYDVTHKQTNAAASISPATVLTTDVSNLSSGASSNGVTATVPWIKPTRFQEFNKWFKVNKVTKVHLDGHHDHTHVSYERVNKNIDYDFVNETASIAGLTSYLLIIAVGDVGHQTNDGTKVSTSCVSLKVLKTVDHTFYRTSQTMGRMKYGLGAGVSVYDTAQLPAAISVMVDTTATEAAESLA